MSVRVRFAPSPTGYLHVGGARTALFNYLYARHTKGTFVLRIEDTDLRRNTEEALRTIVDGLAWLGLKHDEGPYFQSRRLDLYKKYAKQLEDSGRAFWREDPGKGKAMVFKIDRTAIEWDDLVHGPSSKDISAEPDLVIIKSDGFPTYNFAAVIDDHDMNITHVIRGDEHYSNTPKQISLYRALGWEPPKFGHVPLIFDPKGEKLSKRRIDEYRGIGLPVTIEDAREMGYLPEALINFLALLGWSPGGNVEVMSLKQMEDLFTIERVGKTPAKFFTDKLQAFNQHYLKQRPFEQVRDLCMPYLKKAYDLGQVPAEKIDHAIRLHVERIRMLSDIVPMTRFFFDPKLQFRQDSMEKVLKVAGAAEVLRTVKDALAQVEPFAAKGLETALRDVAARLKVKFGQVAQPVRVAVTGSHESPPIDRTLELLGRDRVLARIEETIRTLEGT